ncbi:AfsR/SARP family transcriptional regulator [Neotabrizicola shimadae]|uniref:Response regulator n=1 Tax=Neotabrizicola shimadae TaxID=2807096 RepID=A0A8G0ZTC5_9RHOB|nr:BTAD domain-containing putative transcriptional regulator [Neotabrizicola shimadae]QYZ69080.1 response regulator [Neotabrizicola shimadae]
MKSTDPVNAAILYDPQDAAFLMAALKAVGWDKAACLVTDRPDLLPGVKPSRRVRFDEVALDGSPVDPEEALARMRGRLPPEGPVLVDMGWLVETIQGTTGLWAWGNVADRLAGLLGRPVLSLYDRTLTIEEQLQAAFHAHRQFLAPSGLHANPYWLPAELAEGGALDDRLSFMLARLVPDYASLRRDNREGQMFARGATPSWLSPAPPLVGAQGGGPRWHIHCLGRLRVLIGNRPVEWAMPGAAPKKTRTLFAYLLQSGDKGAHADQIGELLWPEAGTEDQKRARLHHTVAMLRRALGDAQAVIRSGEYYRLNPPPGSWIDIDSFEQLCRRGLSLFKRGHDEAALRIYGAAVRLYGGDLFEDLPLEYVGSETDDWCMPRRIWLREMALKLRYDFAKVCMRSGLMREALEHCQAALAIDPTSEGANAEAMKIFVAQGRLDAMHRQHRQYRAAVAAMGAEESYEIQRLYRELSQSAAVSAKAAKEKPKTVGLP